MKTIGLIIDLAWKAEGKAARNKETGIAQAKRNGHEVYRVEYEKGGLSGDTATLYHYGTKTCEVWLTSPDATITHVYGQSRSDADSVNTFLNYFNINLKYTYKPVNGGFQRMEAN